ncbi:SDR family oxidoreductase [Flavobacterium sp. NRK1]|uniref:SDR family oxidoreductase n=1 Tax=Flavobacterium sp. NRK1 TaxID=2954929 RepID=UPI0020932F33|nr:SDR family oxidoreductase [Flavobacterium sp. NRK1]MCO6147776.1 SDR family oxidoreductase [Flavobacterium sp. NRK1]
MKKTALITGANKSIGYETARQLLAQGYFVYIGSRNKNRGNDAIEKLKAEGYSNTEVLMIDVTNSESITEAAKELSNKIPHLDVLINNAGIPGVMPQEASNTTQENVRTVFDTNFFGVIETTQAFLPLLKKSAEPRIVNVSSDLGSLGNQTNPDFRHFEVKPTAYCASKAALNAYTVMLAYELRDTNFKVNSVNPGYTATDFNNHTGYKTVEEAAKPIVKYAVIGSDGPTGKFFSDFGETPW